MAPRSTAQTIDIVSDLQETNYCETTNYFVILSCCVLILFAVSHHNSDKYSESDGSDVHADKKSLGVSVADYFGFFSGSEFRV